MKRLSIAWGWVLWPSALSLAPVPGWVDAPRAAEVRPVLIRADEPGIARERTYFVGSGVSVEDAVALRDRLIEAGARRVNLFVGDRVVVCDLPAGASVDVPAGFSIEPSSRLESARGASASASWGWIVDAYRTVDRMRAEGAGAPASGSPGGGFDDVVLTIPPEQAEAIQREVEKSRARQGLAPQAAMARNVNQNSEFLGGTLLANLILPESNGALDGNTENWSDADVTAAIQGAGEAMLAWQYEIRWDKMDISYTLNYGTQSAFVRVPIGYEPIQHSMGTDHLWILETMRALGYGFYSNEPLPVVHEFNEAQRAKFHTQWVFTAFVAMSRNVENHRFGGGLADYTAYAYLGGPFLVEPFPAGTDPNGIGERLVYSQIFQHEAGHNFWTLDEYLGAPGYCSNRSGYLNYPNLNLSRSDPGGNELRCQPLQECIMHTAARKDIGRPWCLSSEGHLGVADQEGVIGVPDIFEAAPEIVFQTEGPETVTTNEYTLRFRVISKAVPNQNPGIAPAARIDYAVPLKGGWISFGLGTRVLINPVDGVWDELVEDCEFPMQLGQVGQSVFVVEAENEVEFGSGEHPKVVYFVGVNYSRNAVVVRPNRIDVSWEVVADPFGAKFDVYRLEAGQKLPGTRIAENVSPQEPGVGGFVPYRYIDRDVVPGQEYRYYVEGVFSLPFEGGSREYHAPSEIIAQVAMIPSAIGEVISGIAPNPSRGEVTFSVQVPRTYGGSPRAPVRQATPLDVSVYNVRGQLVRALFKGGQLNDVVTLRWDGADQANIPAPSGVYFVRARAGAKEGIQKVVLIR